jgi:hypothetical protein
MTPAEFEPAISASKQPQTHSLDRAAPGTANVGGKVTQIYGVVASGPSLLCVCVRVCACVRACLEVGVRNGWDLFAPVLEMMNFHVHTCYDTQLNAHVRKLCTPRCSTQNCALHDAVHTTVHSTM